MIDQKVRRIYRISSYLQEQVQQGDITRDTELLTWSILMNSMGCCPFLPVPNVGPSADGAELVTWNVGAYHFEFEIFPDQHVEFFALHWPDDETYDQDWYGEAIPSDVVHYMRRVLT